MVIVCRHFRQAWVVIVAIAGMLSVVGNALASTASGTLRKDAGACCGKQVCSGCCCLPASTRSRPGAAEQSVAFPPGDSLSTPAGACECRSSEQPLSAPKSRPRPSENRFDRDRGEPVDPAVGAVTPATFGLLVLRIAGPAESPLYLRTARLLI